MSIEGKTGLSALAATLLLLCPGAGAVEPAAAPDPACAQLRNETVPASAIALPTKGALVTLVTQMPGYCQVLGSIGAVDPAAPAIQFELDLPATWNRKLLMLGGGGFNGTIPNTAGNVPAGPYDRPAPLARGYAVVGSDSGHQVPTTPQAPLKPGMDASFASNAEALRNYTGEALKKTHDAAAYLIRKRYGAKPERAYFAGGSTGGREALEVVQRWPEDWNGAIAWYPAWNHVSLVLQVGRVARALAAPGGWLNQKKRNALFQAALGACDELDGVADGIVSNVAACNAKFDPATAVLNGSPLRCAGGADLGDACLSDAQIRTLQVFNTPIEFRPALASGETHYPGYNLYGSDLGMARDNPIQPIVTALALGTIPPGTSSQVPGESAAVSVFWDQWVRFVFAGDPHFDALALDPVTRGTLRAHIDELSRTLDANRTDYSAFANKGGKLLLAHGTADVLVSARSTEEYYRRIQVNMGATKVHQFLRFYEVPGYGHAVSSVFNASWDSLTALENWVERGVAPAKQIVSDSIGVPGRTRPLCEYPQWPRYRGSGDVDSATSFDCVSRDVPVASRISKTGRFAPGWQVSSAR